MSSPQSLQSHLNVHTQEKPYKCENEGCSKGYTSVTSLGKHQKDFGLSIKEQKKIQSPECPIKVSTKDNLKYHLKDIQSNPVSFVCQRCGKAVNSHCAYKIICVELRKWHNDCVHKTALYFCCLNDCVHKNDVHVDLLNARGARPWLWL